MQSVWQLKVGKTRMYDYSIFAVEYVTKTITLDYRIEVHQEWCIIWSKALKTKKNLSLQQTIPNTYWDWVRNVEKFVDSRSDRNVWNERWMHIETAASVICCNTEDYGHYYLGHLKRHKSKGEKAQCKIIIEELNK